MYWQTPPAFSPASCLVRVVQESDGRFTARVLGESDLQRWRRRPRRPSSSSAAGSRKR